MSDTFAEYKTLNFMPCALHCSERHWKCRKVELYKDAPLMLQFELDALYMHPARSSVFRKLRIGWKFTQMNSTINNATQKTKRQKRTKVFKFTAYKLVLTE